MKAILEVKFNLSDMFDKETIDNEFNGDVLKAMRWLYKDDSIGIFNKPIKLINIIK